MLTYICVCILTSHTYNTNYWVQFVLLHAYVFVVDHLGLGVCPWRKLALPPHLWAQPWFKRCQTVHCVLFHKSEHTITVPSMRGQIHPQTSSQVLYGFMKFGWIVVDDSSSILSKLLSWKSKSHTKGEQHNKSHAIISQLLELSVHQNWELTVRPASKHPPGLFMSIPKYYIACISWNNSLWISQS